MTERITDRIEIVNADCYTLLDAWPSDAALVTDPPYGIGFALGKHVRPVKNRKSVPRVLAERAIHGDENPFDPTPFLRFKTVCLWGANHYADKLPARARWLVWDKRGDGSYSGPFSDAELAWCSTGGSVRVFRYLWQGIYQAGEKGKRLHQNQKPVALLAWCLETCGIRDGLVIDPFMGSGSLGVACHRAGLRYLGVEIDPEHYATAKARLQRETAQGLLFMPKATAHLHGRSEAEDM